MGKFHDAILIVLWVVTIWAMINATGILITLVKGQKDDEDQ